MNYKIDSNAVEDVLGLSSMQEAIFFNYLSDPGSKEYIEQMCIEITREVSFSVFKKAWDMVAACHQPLRSIFRWKNLSQPVQVILKKADTFCQFYDLTEPHPSDGITTIEQLKSEEKKKSFDLHYTPIRICLCKTSENTCYMLITHHHILYDGWSNGIIMKDFFLYYEQILLNRPVRPVTKSEYGQYIKYIKQIDYNRYKEYWSDFFKTFREKGIKPDSVQKAQNASVESYEVTLDNELKQGLEEFCRKNSVTLAQVLYCSWGIVLYEMNYHKNSLFGSVVSGRSVDVPGIEQMCGVFINTVPFYVAVDEKQNLLALVKKVRQLQHERKEYENTPLHFLKKHLQLPMQETLFNTIVVIENYPMDKSIFSNRALPVADFDIFEDKSSYEITVEIKTFHDIEINLKYFTNVHNREDIIKNTTIFTNILENFLTNPLKEIGSLQFTSDAVIEKIDDIEVDFNF